MKRTSWYRLAALLPAGLIAVMGSCIDPNALNPSPDTVEPFEHLLTMKRHVDQPIPETLVDSILAEAGGLLDAVDTDCPDVHCPVTFTRTGGIGVFSEGGAVLTSEAQLDEVFAVEGDFKIVTFMVGVCGAPAGDDASVVLGCAATGASVTIVYDAPTDVWAHEWGHVQGLPHRNTCDRNLMHAFELETNAVNATERNAFLTPTPGGAFLSLRRSDESACENCFGDGETAPLAERVMRLIQPRYLQGIPREVLADVPATERADALLAAWAMDVPAQARANLARLLGFAGDPRACAVLESWLSARSGEISTEEMAAVAESLLALGRLAALDTTGAALQSLINGSAGDGWALRGLTLRGADETLQPAAAPLARVSILALGLTGVPEARAHLVALQAAAATQRSADRWFEVQVTDALARLDGDFTRLRTAGRALRQP